MPFCSVFRLSIRNGLPLHVGRRVRPTTLQRLHVIDNIAGAPTRGLAGGRAWMLVHKGRTSSAAPLDLAVAASHNPGSFTAVTGRV